MPIHSDLDIRMKQNYEFPYRFKLTRRTPVIIRVDGRAFHTFTQGFNKPFDLVLMRAMQDTCKSLCKQVEGCMIGYTQSDEISLLLVDYKNFNQQAYFDYVLQKVASITASMATLAFDRAFKKHLNTAWLNYTPYELDKEKAGKILHRQREVHEKRGAQFDARAFNIPKEEVTNYFYSRQVDASRNSIEMAGRAYFSHTELHGKNTSMIQDMLHEKYNVNWNDFATDKKRGACCIKETYYVASTNPSVELIEPITYSDEVVERSRWIVDRDIPIFKGDGRDYIEKFVNVGN